MSELTLQEIKMQMYFLKLNGSWRYSGGKASIHHVISQDLRLVSD